MRKLKSEVGETIVETMVAMLIVTLSMVFLANAVMSAAKVNAAIKTDDAAFVTNDASVLGNGTNSATVQFEVEGMDSGKPTLNSVEVNVYKTSDSEYYYYERN